jgi:hypothetical protein
VIYGLYLGEMCSILGWESGVSGDCILLGSAFQGPRKDV